MKYLVKARLKDGKGQQLKLAIDNGTLGKGSIAGGEYIRNMRSARLLEDGTATWVEVCFCNPPLAEERPYWEEYFELLEITDAADRTRCRLKTLGGIIMTCKDCNCSAEKEHELGTLGQSFYQSLT
jgi:hypothetical protein